MKRKTPRKTTRACVPATVDDLNTVAWRDFLLWAWNEPEMRQLFAAKTGVDLGTATSPINAAIDAATGVRESVAAQFIEWATREHWGLEHAPAAYKQSLDPKEQH